MKTTRQFMEEVIDVLDERQSEYGDINRSFITISRFWSAYLNWTVTPADVANMMILLKVSRNNGNGGGAHDDSLKDIAGYAVCASQLHDD
jgi:hypothetical protein